MTFRTALSPVAVIVTAIAVSAAAPAGAVTLINQDGQERTVEVKQGERSQTVTVRGGQTLQDVCGQGCEIHLDGEFVAELADNETVLIKDGYLGFSQ